MPLAVWAQDAARPQRPDEPAKAGPAAQRPVLAIEAGVTASDNGAFAPRGEERAELITSLRPQVAWRRRSAGLWLDLDASATLVSHARGTQENGVLPDARGALKATLADQWLYLDAAGELRPAQSDLFGPRANLSTGAGRSTATTLRLAPYIQRDLGPLSSLLVRHDIALGRHLAGVDERVTSQRSMLRLERKPLVYGGGIELSRWRSESDAADSQPFALDSARLRASVRPADPLVLAAVVGHERSRLGGREQDDPLYGATLRWQPGPRTELSAELERRFFGGGGGFGVRHRMPSMSFALSLRREPSMLASTLGEAEQSRDIRALLDAMFTTRHPDAQARGELVDAVIRERGVDPRVSGPIEVVAAYPQLQTRFDASWVLMRARNTLSLSLYGQTLRRLTREGEPAASPTSTGADSRQAGGDLRFNRQLSPVLSADASIRWSSASGLGSRSSERSTERLYRLALLQRLSPRTGLAAGWQHTHFESNVDSQPDLRASWLFFSLNHRF